LFDSYKDEFILKRIISDFGEMRTGEILDYVYFKTEPMQHGTRNELLDFSVVSDVRPATYKRRTSNATKAQIDSARQQLFEKLKGRKISGGSTESLTPTPIYDELYFDSLKKIEELNS
jgi:hypothetical protein